VNAFSTFFHFLVLGKLGISINVAPSSTFESSISNAKSGRSNGEVEAPGAYGGFATKEKVGDCNCKLLFAMP
jgi:hypothetical protein